MKSNIAKTEKWTSSVPRKLAAKHEQQLAALSPAARINVDCEIARLERDGFDTPMARMMALTTDNGWAGSEIQVGHISLADQVRGE